MVVSVSLAFLGYTSGDPDYNSSWNHKRVNSMKTPDEYIKSIPLDRANLEHIAEYKVINGTLLVGIREAIRAAVKDACKEQRDKCADAYFESVHDHDGYRAATYRAILNAPNPDGV